MITTRTLLLGCFIASSMISGAASAQTLTNKFSHGVGANGQTIYGLPYNDPVYGAKIEQACPITQVFDTVGFYHSATNTCQFTKVSWTKRRSLCPQKKLERLTFSNIKSLEKCKERCAKANNIQDPSRGCIIMDTMGRSEN